MWLEELLLAQHVVGQWSRNLSGSWFQVQSYPQPKKQRAAGNKGAAYIKGFTAFLNIIHQPRPVLGQHFTLQVNSNLHNFVPRVSHLPTPWSERGDEGPYERGCNLRSVVLVWWEVCIQHWSRNFCCIISLSLLTFYARFVP